MFYDLFISAVFLLSSFTFNDFNEITNCNDDDIFEINCGFQNPEDLYLSPSKEKIIISEFGSLAPNTKYGNLSYFDLSSKEKKDFEISYESNDWGDINCKLKSKRFSPHGIDLIERNDGKFMLAVINHLPAETIELFELMENQGMKLIWRGCVDAPENKYFNDVALKRDGSFYATSMFDANLSEWSLVYASIFISQTGEVHFWNKEKGFVEIKNTSGSFPNGIDLSDKEDFLYINYWFSGKTVKFDLKDTLVKYEHFGGGKDNLLVTDSGLWVAAHNYSGIEGLQCDESIIQCPLPFTIHQLSLEDLEEINTYTFADKQMGAATVALPQDDKIWLGTFHGDRIASFYIE